MTLKIATWNINSVRLRADQVVRFVEEHAPDVLCLQEVHGQKPRGGGPRVMGYYHSHPRGDPVPSATDCKHSTGDGRIWAIIGGEEVAFWRDTANGFVPLDVSEESAPA